MDFRPDGNRFDDPVHNDPLHRDPLHADPLNAHVHTHTHDAPVRHEWYHKSPPKWLLVPLLLLLVGAGAAAMNERHHNWQGADNRGYNQEGQVARASVAYQGQVWLPQGAPVLLPDRRMVKVGETVEGLDLYQVSIPTGGGGGPVAQPLVPANQVFLRVGADQYQALNLVHIGNNGLVGPRIVGPRLVGPR